MSVSKFSRITLGAALLWAGALIGTAQAGMFDFFSTSSHVDTMKKGILSDFSRNVTVGEALDTYYDCIGDTRNWQSFTGQKGEEVVEFTCNLKEHKDEITELKNDQIMQTMGMMMGLALVNLPDLLSNNKQLKNKYKNEGEMLKDGQEAIDKSMDLAALELCVQFKLDKKDDKKFSLAYIGFDTTYPDGLQGSIPLTGSSMQSVYDDEDLWEDLLTNSDNALTELLSSLIAARIEAEDSSSSK